MEKYKPLKMGEYKSSYCLSSKNNKDIENTSEFNVVLTKKVLKNDEFKNNAIIKKYKIYNGKSSVNIVCNKEDEEELRDTLEGFGCLVD